MKPWATTLSSTQLAQQAGGAQADLPVRVVGHHMHQHLAHLGFKGLARQGGQGQHPALAVAVVPDDVAQVVLDVLLVGSTLPRRSFCTWFSRMRTSLPCSRDRSLTSMVEFIARAPFRVHLRGSPGAGPGRARPHPPAGSVRNRPPGRPVGGFGAARGGLRARIRPSRNTAAREPPGCTRRSTRPAGDSGIGRCTRKGRAAGGFPAGGGTDRRGPGSAGPESTSGGRLPARSAITPSMAACSRAATGCRPARRPGGRRCSGVRLPSSQAALRPSSGWGVPVMREPPPIAAGSVRTARNVRILTVPSGISRISAMSFNFKPCWKRRVRITCWRLFSSPAQRQIAPGGPPFRLLVAVVGQGQPVEPVAVLLLVRLPGLHMQAGPAGCAARTG
jgi:hypothetical protein